MEKLTLSNPITINGKKVKTLTYDTKIGRASCRERVLSHV